MRAGPNTVKRSGPSVAGPAWRPSAKVWLGTTWTSGHSLSVGYSAHSPTQVPPNEPVRSRQYTTRLGSTGAVDSQRAIYARSVTAHAHNVSSIKRVSSRASRQYADRHEALPNRNATTVTLLQQCAQTATWSNQLASSATSSLTSMP